MSAWLSVPASGAKSGVSPAGGKLLFVVWQSFPLLQLFDCCCCCCAPTTSCCCCCWPTECEACELSPLCEFVVVAQSCDSLDEPHERAASDSASCCKSRHSPAARLGRPQSGAPEAAAAWRSLQTSAGHLAQVGQFGRPVVCQLLTLLQPPSLGWPASDLGEWLFSAATLGQIAGATGRPADWQPVAGVVFVFVSPKARSIAGPKWAANFQRPPATHLWAQLIAQ